MADGRRWRDRASEAAGLNAILRQPGGGQQLHDIQAVSLLESWERESLFCLARIGSGKTTVIGTLPTLLARKGYRNPMIVVPGALRQKTEDEFAAARQHWQITHQYKLASYTEMATVKNQDMLEVNQPDILLFDEPDPLRRIDVGATPKRVGRYIAGRRAKGLKTFVGLFTATPYRDSILDFMHEVAWTRPDLGIDNAECKAWSRWVDAADPSGHAAFDRHFGRTATDEDAQDAFCEWINGLEGVIISDDVYTGAELVVRVHPVDPGMAREFEQLRTLWQRPDGWDLVDADRDADPDEVNTWSIWGVARQMACGFYYRPDPPPPEDWAMARKGWCRYVRACIDAPGSTYDTELQVRLACERASSIGKGPQEWERWRDIKDTFEPRSVPVWVSSHALEAAKSWGRQGPGIIWVDHVAFGHRLEQETGWRYYGQRGLDSAGRSIEAAAPDRPVIASRLANQKGRNLQHQFHRNLVMAMPNAARDWEQLIGRTRRHGQAHHQVTVDVLATCSEHWRSFAKIEAGAKKTQRLLGLTQATLGATLEVHGQLPDADGGLNAPWAWR